MARPVFTSSIWWRCPPDISPFPARSNISQASRRSCFCFRSRLPESSPDDLPGTRSPTVVPKTTKSIRWLRCPPPPPDLLSQRNTLAPIDFRVQCLPGALARSVSTMAMVGCFACRSHPRIFLSASFVPSFLVGYRKVYSGRREADVVKLSGQNKAAIWRLADQPEQRISVD
jgi:hypothetical protein